MTRVRFSEQSSARITGTILDRDGTLVPASEITAATLTLYDLETRTVINDREVQDILGSGSPPEENGVTIYDTLQTDTDSTTYNFAWILEPDDNIIVTERRQLERHRAVLHFTWATGDMNQEVEIDVDNLPSVVTPADLIATVRSEGDVWVECVGTSPTRVCTVFIRDGGEDVPLSSTTY